MTELPELSGTETLVTVLLSLLGLGAMRTAEKLGGEDKIVYSTILQRKDCNAKDSNGNLG